VSLYSGSVLVSEDHRERNQTSRSHFTPDYMTQFKYRLLLDTLGKNAMH